MAVSHDHTAGTVTLSQQAYVEKVLKQHGMDQCKPTNHPFAYPDITVVPDGVTPIPLSKSDHELYRSIVGSIAYAANITRMDLSYIVGVLARYVNSPFNYHLVAAKYVLRYMRGTSHYQLKFVSKEGQSNSVQVYTDSNWANERADRISTGGWIVAMNGRPISWQSKKQSSTSLSSTEAEYYSLCSAVREALFIRQWFSVYCDTTIPIPILCDNQGALHIADHSTNHDRTKHIDIKHFFVREHVKSGSILLKFTPTTDQLADILTKTMQLQVYRRLVGLLLDNTCPQERRCLNHPL